MNMRSGFLIAMSAALTGAPSLADSLPAETKAAQREERKIVVRPSGAPAASAGYYRVDGAKSAPSSSVGAGNPQSLNPRPLPPKWGATKPGAAVSLNPQPLPPKVGIANPGAAVSLNPQPLPAKAGVAKANGNSQH